ncbi:hypothetical protein ACQ4PT_005637 [Festuca glaucescens]
MSEEMKDKFEKYWADVHGLMAIATVLDPRFKLHILQALFQNLYGYEHAVKEVAKIRQLMLSLLNEYQQPSDVGMSNIESTSTTGGSGGGVDEVYEIFDEYMNSKPAASASQVRTELDLYLEEDPLPRTQELDIIGWWKFGGDIHGDLLVVQNVLEDEQEELDANESIVTEE